MNHFIAHAPGKLMIAGEYAVLFGHKGIVSAIDAHAVAQFTPGDAHEFLSSIGPLKRRIDDHPLFLAVAKACREFDITPPVGRYLVDTRVFFDTSGRKLGFGSSAAATVALCKVIFLQHRLTSQQALFDFALFAHKTFSQGMGSGADVAAAIYREAICYQMSKACSAANLSLLDHLIMVDTKRAQPTGDFVQKIIAWAELNRSFLDEFCVRSTDLCDELLMAADDDAFIAIMEKLFRLLDELGKHAHVDIVSTPHQLINHTAKRFGGTAKPSGAGGGDISIALVPPHNRINFITEITTLGFDVLPQKFITRRNLDASSDR